MKNTYMKLRYRFIKSITEEEKQMAVETFLQLSTKNDFYKIKILKGILNEMNLSFLDRAAIEIHFMRLMNQFENMYLNKDKERV